jgi:iron complex outermembrane receptor protein
MVRRVRTVVGTIACVAACVQPLGSSHAAEQAREYDLRIKSQPLARALQEFATQAGVQIIFFSVATQGRNAAPLQGRFTAEAALEQLLNDSRLTFRQINDKTIEICERAADSDTSAAPACAPFHPNPENSMKLRDTANLKLANAEGSRLRRTRALSGALMTAAAMTATAQNEGSALEEVVVTAQKREERLQDVPLAVTALSGEKLAEANVNDTAGLATVTPSLTYTQGAQPSNTNLRIRGIGTAVFGQGLEPSVSVVVDGVVLARSAQGFADLADIERVEVLRGPQGTLFGKNSVGGLINVVTKRPSDTFEADVDVTVAELEEYRVRGTVTGPLSESTSARLTGYYNDVGGHIRNVTLDKDVNGYESLGMRGKLEWDPTDRLNLLFTADYRESEAECCSSQYILVNNPLLQQALLPVVASFNNREETENQITYFNTDQLTFSIEGNLDLDAVTLTSLTAYQDFGVENNQPIDRLNTPTPISLPVTNGWFDINGGTVDVKQISQEFRVTSPGNENFNYVAGLYLLGLEVDRGFQRRSGNCAPGGAPASFGQPCVTPLYRSQGGFKASTENKNIALFGQTDFKIVGNLSGLAGARFQYEEVSYEGVRTDTRLVPGDLPLAGITPSAGSGKSDDTVVTGKVGLQYEFSDDAQTYLTYSTGYKGAGYEVEFTADFVDQDPVEPETAKAWELGYKAQLFGGALSLNTALFHAEYDDLQVQANRGNPDLGIVRFVTTNAGSSSTEGVEVEFTGQPFTGFLLSGGVTYMTTSVDIDGLNCPLSLQAAAPVITGNIPFNTCYRSVAGASPVQNVRGGDLPNAPEWRGSLSARYEFGVPGTSLDSFVQLTASSQSKINFVIEQDPLTQQDSYTTVDASIGLRAQDNRYRLTFFVKNLFDEHYLSLMARSSTLSTATVTPNQLTGNVPKDANRYFGATFGVSF